MEAGLPALAPEAGTVDRRRERLLEPAALNVEGIVVPRDAHRLRDGGEDHLRVRHLAGFVEREACEWLLLVGAEDDAALMVFRDADPRALFRAVSFSDDLDLEAIQRLNHLIRIGGIVLDEVQAAPPAAAGRLAGPLTGAPASRPALSRRLIGLRPGRRGRILLHEGRHGRQEHRAEKGTPADTQHLSGAHRWVPRGHFLRYTAALRSPPASRKASSSTICSFVNAFSSPAGIGEIGDGASDFTS